MIGLVVDAGHLFKLCFQTLQKTKLKLLSKVFIGNKHDCWKNGLTDETAAYGLCYEVHISNNPIDHNHHKHG